MPDFPSIVMSIQNTSPVIGNGMTLGLTNSSANGALYKYANQYCVVSTGGYGKMLPNAEHGTDLGNSSALNFGVTTDKDKSGLIADLSFVTNTFLGKMCIKY